MIRPVATLPPQERERLAPPLDERARPPAVPTQARRRGHPPWFIVVEVLLLLAVPVLGFYGGSALLSTTAGTFTEQPLPGEPGWRVLVDPSPVAAIAEVLNGHLTGITIVAQPGQGSRGGAFVMVPATMRLDDGRSLEQLAPVDALAALSSELRLGFSQTLVVSPTDWAAVIGDKVYSIDNPDPIPSFEGLAAIPVGRINIDASSAAIFLGVTEDEANPLALLFRRRLFWEALLSDPPTTSDPVAGLIEQVAAGTDRVDVLPTVQSGPLLTLDVAGAEELIRGIVPLPSGSQPGDRVVIRVVDRTGDNDARSLALRLGARGFEISEIANALPFDDGPTQLVVPSQVDFDVMRELAADLGADTVSPDPVGETELSTVVLLVGSDIDFGN